MKPFPTNPHLFLSPLIFPHTLFLNTEENRIKPFPTTKSSATHSTALLKQYHYGKIHW